jgi:hypothetical protein
VRDCDVVASNSECGTNLAAHFARQVSRTVETLPHRLKQQSFGDLIGAHCRRI